MILKNIQILITKEVLFLALSISIAICGQILLKFGALRLESGKPFYLMVFQPHLILGLFLYFLSTIFYILAIRSIPLSIAYPSVSISYIAILLAGHFLFYEPITLTKFSGVIFIVTGVGLLWR